MTGLILIGQAHGRPKQTNTGFIQKVLTDEDLVTCYSKSLDAFTPDDKGNVKISVSAKDNFVFAAM